MQKFENSLGNSSSKLNRFGRFLNEKSQDMKEAIINNAQQHQVETITNKFKSFSGYHLSTSLFISNLNGLVKSNSNSTNINISNDSDQKFNFLSDKNIQEKKIIDNGLENLKLNLDPIPALENNFKPLTLKWWEAKKFNYNNCDLYIDVQISSCNICEKCKKNLYDEEIMAGWTLNESDLNVKCIYCFTLLVPHLYIKIKDYNSIQNFVEKVNEFPIKENNSRGKLYFELMNWRRLKKSPINFRVFAPFDILCF